jgi:Zn-dependent alcohol dehydrogenases, class III
MKIKAAVCHELDGKISIEDLDLAPPKANEVLIEVVAAGICHTDASGRNGTLPSPFPIVYGHEGSGIVKEVGPGVLSLKPGDHVVASYPYCGSCYHCCYGMPGECDHAMEGNFGGYMLDGTSRLSKDGQPIHMFFCQSSFATYAVVNEKSAVKVDPEVDLAMLGPLGCGLITGSATVMGCVKPRAGSTIAIFGCGGVGCSAIMGAKIVGCSTIIAVDINEERLKIAQELGATHVINGKNGDLTEAIKAITKGVGVDYGIEATGNTKVAGQGLQAVAPGGEMILIAAGYEKMELDINIEIFIRYRTLRGVIEGATHPKYFLPKLVEMYKAGKFPIDKLIKFYDFEDINQAFDDSASGKTIKPVLRIKK